MDRKKIKELEKAIKYRFRHKNLLFQALTHKSSLPNSKESTSIYQQNGNNERLEFLGDAVLDLVISNYLYRSYPNYQEGELTKFRSHLVNATRLLKKAQEISLEKYIIWKEEETNNEKERRNSGLSDTYEAIIGAIYIDRGIKWATKFISFHFSKEIRSIEQGEYEKDYKSFFQEFSLKTFKEMPVYEIISTEGKEHRKNFNVKVSIKNEIYGQGSGWTVKKAQQSAAQAALRHFGEEAEEKFVSKIPSKKVKGRI